MPDNMRTENADVSDPLGLPKIITLHWSAGNYDDVYSHYHFNIKGDGKVVQTLSTKIKGSHTWHRNSNNIGISMCGMADGFPIKQVQKDACARLVAELIGIYGIDWNNIHDHAYFAKLDDYFPERWDVGDLLDPIIQKAKWYREEIKSKKLKNQTNGIIF